MANMRVPRVQYEDIEDPMLVRLVAETLHDFHTPGLSIAILDNDSVKAKGFGFADDEHETPVLPETLFFTGSTTKSFISALAAGLVESPDHSISWQTPLVELIRDDFVLDQKTPAGQWSTNHVTVEDALSHRTGLPRHDHMWLNGTPSKRDVVRALRFVPVHQELRAGWEYSNIPYIAVSHAIETLTGATLKDLLKNQIFNPLGMLNSTFELGDALRLAKDSSDLEIARGHLWDESSQSYRRVLWDDIPPANGSGGILSNVLDYTRWIKHLMVPSNLNPALSSNAVKSLRMPRILTLKDENRPFIGPEAHCLGLYSQTYRGREVISHSGALAGYMANMLMLPPTAAEVKEGKSGWGVVTMQNSYGLAQDVVQWHLLDEHLETPKDQRFDMAAVVHKRQAEKQVEMEESNVLRRLFDVDVESFHIKPSLAIRMFEGVYQHPAYHAFRVSMSPSSEIPATKHVYRDEAGVLLYLEAAGKAFLNVTATLHHVSGDFWWAHKCSDRVSSWITDEALKVQFVVGVNGEVTGMRYQAEPAMPDELAFFLKVE
ncbi:Putative beta-lactamase/transpeptidase [Septoria linicola]|uniref:Beta-lactamase/transpeptidase n=1 Tax=Septoria linicola TaxID=215465 RepID=A0A9Q9ACU0_9PEZI|nr:putative beta-lactamase/transpeptidase [Septoria linicola]USW47194.1 Putative beta-lactamase/transpeptidase [Septoria linicola]